MHVLKEMAKPRILVLPDSPNQSTSLALYSFPFFLKKIVVQCFFQAGCVVSNLARDAWLHCDKKMILKVYCFNLTKRFKEKKVKGPILKKHL